MGKDQVTAPRPQADGPDSSNGVPMASTPHTWGSTPQKEVGKYGAVVESYLISTRSTHVPDPYTVTQTLFHVTGPGAVLQFEPVRIVAGEALAALADPGSPTRAGTANVKAAAVRVTMRMGLFIESPLRAPGTGLAV